MKNPFLQLLAVAIGIIVAVSAFHFFNSWHHAKTFPYKIIGEIQKVSGLAEHRLPNTVRIESLPGPQPLYNQDLITTQKSSSVVIYLTDAGLTLRLGENSSFIAELDASRQGALIGTLLSGTVSILNSAGKTGSFRLFKEGRQMSLTDLDKVIVPSIPAEVNATQPLGSPTVEETPGLLITATKADESPMATPTPVSERTQSAQIEQGNDVLTNDDILRQLRNQSGFLQRCYLNYLHRNQTKAARPEAVGSGGVVTVSFVVQSNGRVSEAKVVKSDFKDSTLHNCVTEVIERTVYRGFRGNPVPVLEFPITLQ